MKENTEPSKNPGLKENSEHSKNPGFKENTEHSKNLGLKENLELNKNLGLKENTVRIYNRFERELWTCKNPGLKETCAPFSALSSNKISKIKALEKRRYFIHYFSDFSTKWREIRNYSITLLEKYQAKKSISRKRNFCAKLWTDI